MRGLLFAALTTAVLALTGVASAATPAVGVSLAVGQTRWFMPGALQTGELVHCGAKGDEIAMQVPAAVTGNSMRSSSHSQVAFAKNAPTLQVEQHSNGSAEIICGQATQTSPRVATIPYVIGENGVALIRGVNRLAAVEHSLGPPSLRRRHGADCRVSWRALGLTATFAGGSCSGSGALVEATASGSRWSSLNGVHIGDSIAEVAWENPGTKSLGHDTWLLSAGGASGSARLTAVVARDGTVERLVATVS